MKKINVLYVTPHLPSTKKPVLIPFISDQYLSLKKLKNLKINMFIMNGHINSFFDILLFPFRFNQYLKKNKINIIHINWGYLGFLTFFTKIPIIITFRGSDILIKYSFSSNLFKGLVCWCISYISSIYSTFNIAVSKKVGDNIFGKSFVVPNGVNNKTFYYIEKCIACSALNLNPNIVRIFFPCDPHNSVKNYSFVERISTLLKNKLCHQLIVKYNLSANDLNLYLNACDIIIFPSLSEGSPNIIKQAMHTGSRIIASNVGDICELFQNYPNGLAISDYNETIYVNEIIKILDKPRRSQYFKNLDQSYIADKIFFLYKSC